MHAPFQFECSLYKRVEHSENARRGQRTISREEREYGASDVPGQSFCVHFRAVMLYPDIDVYNGVVKKW